MRSLGYFKLFLLAMMFSLAGCLESSFQLSDESRLPKWFVVPEGRNRRDFTVQMDLHSTFGGGKDVFKLRGKIKFYYIKKYTVANSEQPDIQSRQLKTPPEGFPKGYPRYKVVTINNITDIIELRKMEPLFYMTDDPKIWKELGIEQK